MEPETRWQELKYDLASFCKSAGALFPIDDIYIFGSRRFKTGSVRSDIDIIFLIKDHISPYHIREFINNECRALDIFLLHRGKAMSVVNESYLQGDDDKEILTKCGAVKLWSAETGLDMSKCTYWRQLYASHVDFQMTVMPSARMQMSIDGLKRKLASENLPTDPIIGETEHEIAEKICKVAQTLSSFKTKDFPGSRDTSRNFAVNPESECDFQDLFWISAKPWIQSIRREQVEVTFDGQKKISDFNISGSRFIIEFKFAKDKDTKRNIVKTLDGLSTFYSQNANVKFLLFIIFAKQAADINISEWEDQYSDLTANPTVMLKVIPVD